MQEVRLVQRTRVGESAQNDEEHEDDGASEENEGRHAEASAYGGLVSYGQLHGILIKIGKALTKSSGHCEVVRFC